MNYHFIAIGGAIMHNLALTIREEGHEVSGSDDEIFEPALSRLSNAGILPAQMGWFPEKITPNLDGVILGMHARGDNPELLRAKEYGLPVWSFPEFVFERLKRQNRIVVAGSHGKTTVTSMIMHVFRQAGLDFNYLVGAQIKGFDLMVRLSASAHVAVLEGDEYLSSALNPVPKFLSYRPHIAIITGISWDHINVFPTRQNYLAQFEAFLKTLEPNGYLIYNVEDEELFKLVSKTERKDLKLVPYKTPEFSYQNGGSFVWSGKELKEMKIFGRHNFQNLEAARLACEIAGIDRTVFYEKIGSFEGASKRLECLFESPGFLIYRDFAHAPSKLSATLSAVRERFPEKKLYACMELHTFSSLNENFLEEYAHTMDSADEALVFVNDATFEHKKMQPISDSKLCSGFARKDLIIGRNPKDLHRALSRFSTENSVWLMMSSGNWGGLDINSFIPSA